MRDRDKKMVSDFSKSLLEIKFRRPQDYKQKVSLYKEMKDGADGGEFRSSGTSIRSLHFKKWKDIHFHYLLELIGEIDMISDEERNSKYKDQQGFFEKIINFFG